MSLKSIAVHVDNKKRSSARLTLALNLAKSHGSHLIGIFAIPHPYVPTYMSTQLGPEMYEVQRKLANEAAAEAEKQFHEIVDREEVSAEWRADEGYPPTVLCTHARYADITVLGQFDPDEEQMLGNDGVVEEVVLEAGRPVLVVPYSGHFETVGNRVLIAWNASREAVRAVNDALPFLENAKQVTVMSVNPEKSDVQLGDIPGADLAQHLARHNVKVEASPSYGTDIEVGDVLLSRAADLGVDLIVMGAYGHSRMRELVLGGASRHLLKHMTVPILMSH